MTSPLVFTMPGNEDFGERLVQALGGERGDLSVHVFPDKESLVRLHTAVGRRDVILVCSLNDPDPKFLPLAFAASTARDLGARSVGLVAPYLSYMRQDKRFHKGEAITSVHFARLLGDLVSWLVTVDPHLHRHQSLSEIYSIPTTVVHAAAPVADWIRVHVPQPVVIGPDAESEQWVAEVAGLAGAPYRVCRKRRKGDLEVLISLPDMDAVEGRVPVLVDDIVSSGRTLLEAARLLRESGFAKPFCVAVHFLAGEETSSALEREFTQVKSTNTILHGTNQIDLTSQIAAACRPFLNGP
ncbi:MAG: ribose-phosphate pyrophosphokinase [Alsobacter sp.]